MVRPFLLMDTTEEPIETIQSWQDWYRKHRIVAEMDKPLVTKDSRENMHDTTNATIKEIWDDASTKAQENASTKAMWMEKAKDHFADTLAEYQYELSGKDFYKAFYQAAHENMEAARKEYERAKELVDMLRYHHLGQDWCHAPKIRSTLNGYAIAVVKITGRGTSVVRM